MRSSVEVRVAQSIRSASQTWNLGVPQSSASREGRGGGAASRERYDARERSPSPFATGPGRRTPADVVTRSPPQPTPFGRSRRREIQGIVYNNVLNCFFRAWQLQNCTYLGSEQADLDLRTLFPQPSMQWILG